MNRNDLIISGESHPAGEVGASAAQVAPADLADFEAFVADQCRHRTGTELAEFENFLRANPGLDAGDWKGKSCPLDKYHVAQGEVAWQQLGTHEVRQRATDSLARHLPRNFRQAAARDGYLIFNPLARRYRVRLDSDPRPEPVEESVAGVGQRPRCGEAGNAAPAPSLAVLGGVAM